MIGVTAGSGRNNGATRASDVQYVGGGSGESTGGSARHY